MIYMRVIIWLLLSGLCVPAYSQEPVDIGINLDEWHKPAVDNVSQQPRFGTSTQAWWDQPWGLHEYTNLTDIYSESYERPGLNSLSLKQQLFFTPENTIIGMGLGVQNINVGRNDTRSGLHLSLGGRMGLGKFLTFYGESVWMPGLFESDGFDRLSGLEIETGLMLNPLPNLSIRAAYRKINLDYTLTGGTRDTTTTQGIIIGTGIHW